MRRTLRILMFAAGVAMTACGAPPEPVEALPPETTPDPVETAAALPTLPALDGCPAVSPGYLARPERSTLRIDEQLVRVHLDPASGQLEGATVLTVEATAPASDLLLSWREGLEPVGLAHDAALAPLGCELGKLPTGSYLRVVLDAPLAPGQTHTLHVAWRAARAALGEPLETLVSPAATFLTGSWYPRPLASAGIATGIEVVVPGEPWVLGPGHAASSLPLAGALDHTVVRFEPVRSARPPAVAVVGGADSVWALPLAGGGDLRVSSDAMDEARVEDIQGLVDALSRRLGALSLGTLGILVVERDAPVLTSGPGLVVIDRATFAGDDGASVVLDAAARQWLEQDLPLSTAMREALVRYLLASASEDPAAALAALEASYLEARAALPRRPAPGEGDVPVSELTMVDTMFVPIAYGRLPVVLAMLERTVGTAAFDEGLRRFLAVAAEREAAAVETSDDVEALAGEVAAPTGFVDALLRGNALLEVEATCRGGRLEVAQTGRDPVVPLTLLATVGEDGHGDAVLVSFEGATATVETEACAGAGAHVTFPGQLIMD